MNELALPKTGDAEGIAIGLKWGGSQLLVVNIKLATNFAKLVLQGGVVILIGIDLQILSRLAKSKRVKATISGQRPVQPVRPSDGGQPKRISGKFLVASTTQSLGTTTGLDRRLRGLLQSLSTLLDNGLGTCEPPKLGNNHWNRHDLLGSNERKERVERRELSISSQTIKSTTTFKAGW